MNIMDLARFVGHMTACLAMLLALAWLGRTVARWLRQPDVIGEIVGGLLIGPALFRIAGAETFNLLLPSEVLHGLKVFGQAGLALFLLGLTHELLSVPTKLSRRSVSWIIAGGLLPSMLAGTLLAGWVLLADTPETRGTAPLPAFVLFVAVALSITAVPVLSRLLSDRRMTTTREGRLALTSAIALDASGWLLLSIAIGLSTGSLGGSLRVLVIMTIAAVPMLLVRKLLLAKPITTAARRHPRLMGGTAGVAVITAALTAEQLGVTLIFGAVLFGLAIPSEKSPAWAAVVSGVTRVGRPFVPVFFVVTGVTVFVNKFDSVPWTLLTLATVLGVIGKVGGGYLGARLGNERRWTAARVGILLNTRGLTELIVLQAGYSAGIITPMMFLALVVMAVVTTVLTGPLLSLLDWTRRRSDHVQRPETSAATTTNP
jgi:Kef-type K+ transport system membrane component KefB